MNTRFIAVLALAGASLHATAAPSGPIGCGGTFGVGGCAPYGQLIFFGDDVPAAAASIFEYDRTVLDQTVTSPHGTARGIVDLANGEVKTYARAIDDGNPSVGRVISVTAQAADVFVLRSSAPPSPPITFQVAFSADGIGDIGQTNSGGLAFLNLGGPSLPGFSGGKLDDLQSFQEGRNAPFFNDFQIHLMTFANLNAALDVPFELDFFLRTDVGENTSFDFLHTARLSFVLPEGVTIESMGGYRSAAVLAVPEPSTWLLLVAGLATVGRLGARRRPRAP
jgi:hypothetical protein